MRPAMRLPLREALYVCSNCRQEVTPRVISPLTRQFRRSASSDSPTFLERTRRKLWNTEKPPGAADPYTGESQLARGAEPEEGLANGEVKESETLATGDGYQQAQTWDGLDVIGYLQKDKWLEEGPRKADKYTRYGANLKPRATLPALRQTTVEICLMSMLGKPLASICDVASHDNQILQMLDSCYVEGSSTQQWNTALRFSSQTNMEALLFVFNQIGGESTIKVEPSETLITDKSHKHDTHRDLSLADPEVKFAFVKRFSQLIGRRIPDKAITTSHTVGDILAGISSQLKEKPIQVTKELNKQAAAGALPANVKFSKKRLTKSQNDEDHGRKKAIVSEIYRRGLNIRPASDGGFRFN
ncbi:uncharacterized protein N7482_005428 [Penicillium canariense]|uniref:Large ribosomal subunit protein mL50 n=1 Tax=Penicillium canariense TaxID=189055 RepID=A0A9W9LMJ5_9EURO|nr:uncharacterized protein N7482_005428 [Penicillium canariense]KAJ5166647.1 hypothetical protein N7482_005428 [Penicillium canariense]